MFELFFAVAMKESDNITQNPACEWQLGTNLDPTVTQN
jgi:hypothetical protein